LPDTRAIIKAALDGILENVAYTVDPVFGLMMPAKCPGVRSAMLNPANTWDDKEAYFKKANNLAQQFVDNFRKFEDEASEEIVKASPKVRTDLAV